MGKTQLYRQVSQYFYRVSYVWTFLFSDMMIGIENVLPYLVLLLLPPVQNIEAIDDF